MCCRDADKQLAAATKGWKHEVSSPHDPPQVRQDKENVAEVTGSHSEKESTDKMSVGSVEVKRKSPPVGFGSLSMQKHNVAQLNKHTALMQLNKQERRKVSVTCSV